MTADTLSPRTAGEAMARDAFCRGMAEVAAAFAHRVACAVTAPGEVSIHFVRPDGESATRFGYLLREWARQRGWASLFGDGLANMGDRLRTMAEGADRLSARFTGSAMAQAHEVVARFRDLVECGEHDRSDRLFWAWTDRPGDGPSVCVDHDDMRRASVTSDVSERSIDLRIDVDALALARMDDALLACDDDAARTIGRWLAESLAPFDAPPRRLRWGGAAFAIHGVIVPGRDHPESTRATDVDGAFARAWLLDQMERELARSGATIAVRQMDANDEALLPAPAGSLDLVCLGRGARLDRLRDLEHAVVLDLHGACPPAMTFELASRHVMLVTAASFEVHGERMRDGDGDDATPEPALVEALLAAIDGPRRTQRAWRDAEAFRDAVRRHGFAVGAWHGHDGELGVAEWQAFLARRRGDESVPSVPADATMRRLALAMPLGGAGLPEKVFDADHLRSGARLIDPASGETIDYAGLQALSSAMAARLRSLGLRQGDAVACVGAQGIAGVALFMACALGGYIFAPLDPGASASAFAAMLDALDPALVVIDHPAPADRLTSTDAWRCLGMPALMATDPTCPACAPPSPADGTVAILFTSGSTGVPRPMRHTHADFLTCGLNYERYVLRLSPADCLYTPSRMCFAYGLNNLVMGLLAGASVVLAAPLPPGRSIAAVIATHGVSVFMAVPVVYKMLLAQGDAPAFERLRLCVSAGERLSARLCAAAQAFFGVPVVDGIGSTEALSTFISNRPGHALPGCTGWLVPGFAARLLDDAGRPCRIGEPGLLSLAGPCLAAAVAGADGWFDTQDSFFLDAKGRFHYLGRVGTVLKINACWFSPDRLETTLASHPDVSECAVGMVTDEHGLQRPKAFVVIREGTQGPDAAEPLWDALRQLSKSRLGKDHYPHFFEAVDALPRTSSGKLARSRLAATVARRGIQPS